MGTWAFTNILPKLSLNCDIPYLLLPGSCFMTCVPTPTLELLSLQRVHWIHLIGKVLSIINVFLRKISCKHYRGPLLTGMSSLEQVKIFPAMSFISTFPSRIGCPKPEFGADYFSLEQSTSFISSFSYSQFHSWFWNADCHLLLSLHADYIHCPYCMKRFNETNC
jgi:hypothetical protein